MNLALRNLIFDFDSTFVQGETLDELARIALQDHPDRARKLAEVQRLTSLGMEGKLRFEESPARRLELLSLNRSHINTVVTALKSSITPSFIAHRDFIRDHGDQIYILTGSFREVVLPVVASFGIPEEQIFGNLLHYDSRGRITGIDPSNPLARDGGKIRQVEGLNLEGEVVVIGDGYNDYQLKAAGLADRFFAFVENVRRPRVVAVADRVLESLDDLVTGLMI